MRNKEFNNRTNKNGILRKQFLVFMLLIMVLGLVGCESKAEEIQSWNEVAGEGLVTQVSEEEIEEAIDAINKETESNEEKAKLVDTKEITESQDLEGAEMDVQSTEQGKEKISLTNLSFEASVTEDDDDSIHATFRIIDGNGKTIQVIENDPFFTKDWFDMFSDSSCFFVDYNFDGYLDVVTIGSSGYVNAYNFVYLWDSNEEEFVFSKEGSDIANAVLHEDKKQIISVSRDAGLPVYRLYEVKDGKITLVAEILEVHNEDGTVVCTEIIFQTGIETVVVNRDELNEIWDGYNIELYN